MLERNNTLVSLDCSCNNVGVAGAHALARALLRNTVLTQLNLRYNGIHDEGAIALAASLNASRLRYLDLSSNGEKS